MTMELRALVHLDPLFAAGSGSFSFGLESLVRDGFIREPRDVASFVEQVMTQRWNTFDRVYLAMCWSLDDSRLIEIDELVEVSTIGVVARQASRRAGRAMLGMWARLNDAAAITYRKEVKADRARGHLSVVQALIYRNQELSLDAAETLSCGTLLSVLVSSAVRLGVVGHRDAQRIILESTERMQPLLCDPVDTAREPTAWTPLQDIAIERHSRVDARLFAS